ncbi:MAG TPA: hypothetical protein VG319_01995 [Polyangia bacterium]|jgi:hypothetical protein|nr:hypothetical protein [Polyangia bacterium]
MNKRALLGILAAGGLAVLISCDGGSSATSAGLDANDCPYGTFRPVGLSDCVFPATDVNNQAFGVSDNRCASGQPAIPPQCVSDAGERAYLSTSSKCATGYRFLPGACDRNNVSTGFGTGSAGATSTGIAFPVMGAAGDASTGAAGAIGTAGSFATVGEAGTGGAGASGSDFAGAGGVAGTGGASGTDGSASASSVDASDGSAESSF